MARREAGREAGVTMVLPRVRAEAAPTLPRRVLQTDNGTKVVVPNWEWALVVLVLFVLGRTPVLFYRQRIAEVFDGSVFYVWQDDGIMRAVFAAALISIYVVAARYCEPRNLLRQPFLLAVLAFAMVSALWSVEETVTLWRSGLFVGTAIAGWYLGERFTIRDQLGMVGAVAAVGAAVSVALVVIWPEVARPERLRGVWTGVYVNRNLLALVMCFGLLATPFLMARASALQRMLLGGVAGLEAFVLFNSGSRTGIVALTVAWSVGLALWFVRIIGRPVLTPAGGAAVMGSLVAVGGVLIHWNWAAILELLGRSASLSGRTNIWGLDRWLADLAPWKGWGFEAIWAHPPAIRRSLDVLGVFPYSSHNGYYEMQLGLGRIGLGLLLAFLATAVWRAHRFAWRHRRAESLWPMVFLTFAIVANFSESLFVSSEATWALTVAAAVTAAGAKSRSPRLSLAVVDTQGHGVRTARQHDNR